MVACLTKGVISALLVICPVNLQICVPSRSRAQIRTSSSPANDTAFRASQRAPAAETGTSTDNSVAYYRQWPRSLKNCGVTYFWIHFIIHSRTPQSFSRSSSNEHLISFGQAIWVFACFKFPKQYIRRVCLLGWVKIFFFRIGEVFHFMCVICLQKVCSGQGQ